ncbi:LysR family transcriptional regulator [Paenibacillus puerhi]|uniref:LysR family transcriptional regulator n=1 Tax=Paenibacillus puerhi TaxID=2692622 RepID=UPI001359BB29|nr:LysR family transcriptional regulator [Paenibacillus puerhi]
MNIENIEAFIYVVHFGGFKKAAHALFLSQPAVTARIQSLERELDLQLFERNGKLISLSEDAKQFLPYAEQILGTYRKSIKHLRKSASPDVLRIGCTSLLSQYVIPDLLPLFRKRYPDVRFKLVTDTNEQILEKLLNKELEYGLVKSLTHPNIEATRLFENHIVLAVRPDHPFAAKKTATLKELASQAIVFYECGSLDWTALHRMFESSGTVPRIEAQLDNLEAAKSLVSDGAGVGFLPELCIRKELADGRLKPITITSVAHLSHPTTLITLKESVPLYREALIELLESHIKFPYRAND